MRRSRLESILHDYVNGDLDEADCREIERRIASDPAVRALHDEVRSAQDALKLLRDRPEPPVAASHVFPTIRAAIAAQAFEPRPRLVLEGLGTRYYRRIAVAATLLFALTVGYVSLAPRPEPSRPAVPSGGVARPPLAVAKGAIELGKSREGISAAEFFRLYESASDIQPEQVELGVNVIDIAESR